MSDRRFERQVRFAPLGEAGQERLQSASVLLVGCGALGGVLAQHLVRAGVGRLVLVDRDVVEETNLPRQVLFDERHALDSVPKVEAAAETLARAGGPTILETHAEHLDADNIHALAEGTELLLDGTDNMPTRYLMNDYCVDRGVPWVYGGVVSGAGLLMPVIPGRGPCLRCVFRDPPPPGSLPTCDTAGVIAPAVGAVASMQAGLGLRLLVDPAGVEPALIELDAWNGAVHRVRVARDPEGEIVLDVEGGTVSVGGRTIEAHIPEGVRQQFLSGTWNATQILLDAGEAIEAVARHLPYVAGY